MSAAHPDAVEAGMAVLADGGNAVDAAIATAFAVSVVEPFASGMGGSGAALVYEPDGQPLSYEYRAPVPQSGKIPASNTGIPGFVAGMGALHEAHGTLDFTRLVEPAITLAQEGAETSESLAFWLQSGGITPSQAPQFYPGGAPLEQGDEFVQEELAETLRRVAEQGPGAFYRGELADDVAEQVSAIDTESLAAYEVRTTEPAVGEFAGHTIVSSAPPLAGAALIQLLQIAEAAGVGEHEPGTADHIHALAQAWRIAEQHLNWEMADPVFVDVPVDELTDADRNARLAAEIQPDATLSVNRNQPRGGFEIDDGDARDDGNTTHITVVDADGTTVSMTNTISNFWGSGDYAMGFFLNDELRNFDIRPGSPNVPHEPGKRIVGSSCPTIVLDGEGRPVLALGSPGGLRIPNILSQLIVRWVMHDQELAEAVEAPRFHLEGGTVMFEDIPADAVISDLRGRGHPGFESPTFRYYFGSVQALEIDYEAQEIRGAADPRRDGDWAAENP